MSTPVARRGIAAGLLALLGAGMASKASAQQLYGGKSGGTPGGSNGQIQYNNSGAFGGDAGLAYSGQVWNNGATTFTAVSVNITDTASAAASKLLDLQVGGTTAASFRKDGMLVVGTGGNISLNPTSGAGLVFGFDNLGVTFGASNDLKLVRDAANTLAIRNGTNAQSFNVYNTYTDASNYQRVRLTASPFGGGGFGLISEGIGTGSAATTLYLGSTGSLAFRTAGVTSWLIDTSGNLVTNGGTVDIGGSGTSPRNVNVGTSLILGLDVKLNRDAANTLALRNGVNAQAFNVYNTYTDASNYETGFVRWTSNTMQFGTGSAGTGIARNVSLVSLAGGINIDGSSVTFRDSVNAYATRWQIQVSTGHFFAGTDNTYDIGASGANRPRNVYVAGLIKSGGTIQFGSSQIYGGTDTNLQLQSASGSGFNLLQFGGATVSFPALKRSTTSLQARLADDSAFTAIQGKLTTDTAYTAGAPPAATGYVTIYDSTGTAYRVAVVV